MSPTSYQAAPPRVSTIADARASVKPLQIGSMILRLSEGSSTTRCTAYSRKVRPYSSSSEHRLIPCSIDPGSTRRCRIAAPSPPHRSSDPWEPCGGNPPAPDRLETVAGGLPPHGRSEEHT